MIKIENLSKSYGDLEVLKNISVEINKGEVISVSYTHLTLPTKQRV